ncbi:MAG TPA: MlaD family protein [Nitriliruptorales bacterium]|nr:MlaD family protein [Nitriliruptorales bacterium]
MSGERPLLKFVAFTAVCVVFAGWLIVTIGNIAPFADRVSYQAAFADATGLVENDAVKIAGVDVGKVNRIHVERGRAIVTFAIRDDLPLGRDTTISVRWRNLLGLRYLYVHPAGTGQLPAGHRFPTERTVAVADFGELMERLVPIQRALEPQVANVVVRALDRALDDRELQVQQLIADAGSLTTTLAERDRQIGRVLQNAADLAGAYAQREQALRQLLNTFADVSETVAARNDEVERIVVDLADAQAELARFLDRNEEEIQGVIDELDAITSILTVNQANLEDIVTHLGRGLVFYHRTSRWGQWFNVRAAGVSEGGEVISTDRGACLPRPVPPDRQRPGAGGSDECSGDGVVLNPDGDGPAGPATLRGLFEAGLGRPAQGGG